jgi:hypothetical protein
MAEKRKDIVVIVIQYDRDVDQEVLDIHEMTEEQREGVVSVRVGYGNAAGQVGMGLGTAPVRYEAPASQHTR